MPANFKVLLVKLHPICSRSGRERTRQLVYRAPAPIYTTLMKGGVEGFVERTPYLQQVNYR